MVSDLRLLAFCRILDFRGGGVGQTDKVLLALVRGLLLAVSTRFTADDVVETLLFDAGNEKAMLRHLSSASLEFRIAVAFLPADAPKFVRTFFGVITVRGRMRAPLALVGVLRALMLPRFTHYDALLSGLWPKMRKQFHTAVCFVLKCGCQMQFTRL